MHILNAKVSNYPFDLINNAWGDTARKAAIEARRGAAKGASEKALSKSANADKSTPFGKSALGGAGINAANEAKTHSDNGNHAGAAKIHSALALVHRNASIDEASKGNNVAAVSHNIAAKAHEAAAQAHTEAHKDVASAPKTTATPKQSTPSKQTSTSTPKQGVVSKVGSAVKGAARATGDVAKTAVKQAFNPFSILGGVVRHVSGLLGNSYHDPNDILATRV